MTKTILCTLSDKYQMCDNFTAITHPIMSLFVVIRVIRVIRGYSGGLFGAGYSEGVLVKKPRKFAFYLLFICFLMKRCVCLWENSKK